MHEFSLCRALLGQLERLARDQGAAQVIRVTLRVGPLSGAEPKLLRDAFPLASEGSLAEGAELVIETVPVLVYCPACQTDSEASPNDLRCRRCGAADTQLRGGDELLLVSADLRTEPAIQT
ncbi:hydrogenase maturation nickel metallochaperone HypA/HybF [Mangrovitalea sediminis]|uniref:hydrogenase maturation nickel metallochaperone HypA/HybF n=1 Tax=Mangrovitalea sediminis TaxID=1982043 RepID=UPI000BE55FF6|nr:hydrogenase maturation nickel metallochaperone HypA [Mangrovitalea sediminis]